MSSTSLRFSLERDLLRLGPAWALLAGVALGKSAATSPPQAPFTAHDVALLVLALILVEPIWGGVGSQMSALAHSLAGARPAAAASLPPLPYAQPQAPLTRLWLWLRNDSGPGADRHSHGFGLAAILLALIGVVALMLLLAAPAGRAAMLSSLVVILLAGMGSLLHPAFPATAQLLFAAVAVALPWLLGLGLLAGQTAWPTPSPSMWLCIGGFTALAFAEEFRRSDGSGEGVRLLAISLACYGLVVGALIWVGAPWAAGLTALVFSIPAWRLIRGRPQSAGRWHLLALMTTTFALIAGG